MTKSVLRVHVHAGCPCPCPCCMSMSISILHAIFMLHVHVNVAFHVNAAFYVNASCPCLCQCFMSMSMSMLYVHVYVHVNICRNAGMPDHLASGQSCTGLKKLTMAELVQYWTKKIQFGMVLVWYGTKIWDAGMPMPALVSSMPMPSYAIGCISC
jgi:hypothetical protein